LRNTLSVVLLAGSIGDRVVRRGRNGGFGPGTATIVACQVALDSRLGRGDGFGAVALTGAAAAAGGKGGHGEAADRDGAGDRDWTERAFLGAGSRRPCW